MLSRENTNLVRFQICSGDEWPGDTKRNIRYNRAELRSQAGIIATNRDVWFAWNMRLIGTRQRGTTCVFQIFHEYVEFQIQLQSGRIVFRTYQKRNNRLTSEVVHVASALADYTPECLVIRLRPKASQGHMQVWRNGFELFSSETINLGTDGNGRYSKLGLYRKQNLGSLVSEVADMELGEDLSHRVTNPSPIPESWIKDMYTRIR
ncbi:heparin lyase I family protein [Ciceribacter selenitireducens]